MKRFQIAFCYTVNGEIEKDLQGYDNIYVAVVCASTKEKAVDEFFKIENFKEKPDIVDIVDLGENTLFD